MIAPATMFGPVMDHVAPLAEPLQIPGAAIARVVIKTGGGKDDLGDTRNQPGLWRELSVVGW